MKITIVTVVLNRAKDLERTIQSVLSFARPDLDYIVIDGGSTDGSIEVIRAYAEQLKYWLSEPDDNVYHAMNKGWVAAKMDSRVLFLGAGDILLCLPEREGSEDTLDEVLYGNVELDKGKVFHSRTGVWLKLFNSLHHQALLVPKQLHPEPPFDTSYPLYADFDFNQRLFLSGAVFRFEPKLLAYAAQGGLTEDLCLDEIAEIIRKNYGQIWRALSIFGFSLVKYLPFLRVLRPIR